MLSRVLDKDRRELQQVMGAPDGSLLDYVGQVGAGRSG